jgi:Tfp pilus assembly protein PilP
MNLIKLITIFIFLLFSNSISIADNHSKKEELNKEVKKITEQLDSLDEELPLNDPFAGQSSSNNRNTNAQISEEEMQDDMSLYNFKLVGLIAGKSNSYVSLVKSDGEPFSLTIGQYLGKIRLVDLRLSEVIFKKEDGKFIIIDFNNQIRETNEY